MRPVMKAGMWAVMMNTVIWVMMLVITMLENWEERRRVIKVGEHMVRKLMMKVCHYSLYNQQMKCYKTIGKQYLHIFLRICH